MATNGSRLRVEGRRLPRWGEQEGKGGEGGRALAATSHGTRAAEGQRSLTGLESDGWSGTSDAHG